MNTASESEYDKFYTTFRDQLTDITVRLEQLQDAEDNYYIMAKHVLSLVNRAYDLFLGSEADTKRQLIKLVLSNLRLDSENLVYDVEKACPA